MLGEFVDDYTVNVIDVFAMPQSGTVSTPIPFHSPCFEYVSNLTGSFGWSCRSSVSSQNVGYAQTNRTPRDGCWLVPFSSRIWLLAFWSWYQHTTEFRSPFGSGCCSCSWSDSICQGEGSFLLNFIRFWFFQVVIDAFRTINAQTIALNQEPRQTTSNIGHLQKPSIQALIHGLNRHYYSIPIAYRSSENEQQVT